MRIVKTFSGAPCHRSHYVKSFPHLERRKRKAGNPGNKARGKKCPEIPRKDGVTTCTCSVREH